MSIPLEPAVTKLLMDKAPREKEARVMVSFFRMKYDLQGDLIIEDIVAVISQDKLLGVWYAGDFPFHVEGITP